MNSSSLNFTSFKTFFIVGYSLSISSFSVGSKSSFLYKRALTKSNLSVPTIKIGAFSFFNELRYSTT